jgi:DNA-binding MarR family transcriptional regulator
MAQDQPPFMQSFSEEIPSPLTGAAPAAIDALAVANGLRPVLLHIYRALRHEAHELGVTSTQASLLATINRLPHIGLGELALQEHLTSPTLVSHIDKLVTAGLVERTRANPNDRRRVELTITPAGAQVLQTLRERRTAWLAARLETLPAEGLAAIAAAIEPLRQVVRSRA